MTGKTIKMAMEKTFGAHEAEARLYTAWEDRGCFKAGANAKPGAEAFSIVIPPPNVTGSLHMGHAFNNTLQDILIRWHRMRGHDTLWQPGTDHAGIATQMVTERDMAANGEPTRREMGRDAFVTRVWQQKQHSRGTIIGQLKRLGASCDWSREAFTMGGAPGDPDAGDGPNFHDAVIKVFVDMYDKGLIYRGKRLVNWDPHFETAISDLEVENVEVDGFMWHFKYPLAGGATYDYVEKDEDGNVTLREVRDYISIATTRPETMLGDGAVAVHPGDTRYAPIVGQLCEIPVGPKEHRRLIPIITDEYPDPAFGSGAVKITGAHDFNDYAVAKRNAIPLHRLMDVAGRMRDDGADYATAASAARQIVEGHTASESEIDAINLVPDAYRGMDRFAAREAVIADVTAEGLAVMVPATDPRLGKAAKAPDQVGGDSTSTPSDGPVTPAAATVTPAAASVTPAPAPGSPSTGAEAPALVPLVEPKKITQPFGDRSKVVIEPMLTDQWFVETSKIVQPAIDAVRNGDVAILPEQDKKVYFNWLENIEPWCISRQLWWGHRIPVWYGLDIWPTGFRDDEGNNALDEVELMRLVGDGAFNHADPTHHCGAHIDDIAVRFRADLAALPAPLHAAQIIEVADRHTAVETLAAALADYNVSQDPTHLTYPVWRDADVLDTWFSSGLWPIGTLGWPDQTDELARYFPTSVLVTGFDIIFFWVARMMMMQYAVTGQKPFSTVYVHALVRDEKGKKMSKSLGNVLDPLDLIDEYGCDAVRFTLSSMAAMGRDLKLSKDRIAGYRNFGTKLWNAVRFAEMNGVYDGDAGAGTDAIPTQYRRDTDVTQTANKWIIGETARALAEVDAALAAYRFNDASSALYAHVWGKVCDWYVEFAKPLFASQDPEIVAETRRTMRWVLDQCMVLMHPFMPFITEELWGLTGARAKMLVHTDWPTYQAADITDETADREMGWVIALIDAIRSLRAQMHVPAGAKLPLLQLDLDAAGQAAWDRNATLIQRLARVISLSKVSALPKGAVTIPVEGGTFALPLADVIDVAEEQARLEKTLGKLAKDLGGLRGRLNNPKFVASAPEDVIVETRDLLAQKEDEDAKLRAALDRLAALA